MSLVHYLIQAICSSMPLHRSRNSVDVHHGLYMDNYPSLWLSYGKERNTDGRVWVNDDIVYQ
jgi:hypothetical protein